MMSFREFLLERNMNGFDDWEKYVGVTFVELPDDKFKIKVGDEVGVAVFNRQTLRNTLNNVGANTDVKRALNYSGVRVPVNVIWNALSSEYGSSEQPVSAAVHNYVVKQSNNLKLGSSSPRASRRDLDTVKLDNGITKQDEAYYAEHYFSGDKENVYGKSNRGYYTDRVVAIKNMLRDKTHENGLECDDSIEDMEKALVANGIEIETYENDGKKLEKDIADTLDKTLDPTQNKGNIRISDDTRKNDKFISALEDSGLRPDDKLLNAKQANNNDESDVVVSWNSKAKSDKRKFYIEAKLDYDSAPVSHFFVNIQNSRIRILDGGKIRSSAVKADKQQELDQFISDLEGQEKVSKILLVSEEFKRFTEAYSQAIDGLMSSSCQKRLGTKFDRNVISKEQFRKLSDGCDKYIQLYKTQYQELLGHIVSLCEADEDYRGRIISTFRKYFPTVDKTDDEGLVGDPVIRRFMEAVDKGKREDAVKTIQKIRTIHNKFSVIIKNTKRNIDSLKDNDKALFMLWAFVLKSKANKVRHYNLMGFELNPEENSRRILSFQSTERKYTKMIGELISKYYGGMKDVAYIQIGSDTFLMKKSKDGKDFDPLGIAEKYKLEQFSDSLSGIRIDLDVLNDLSIRFTTHVKTQKHNDNAFGTSITGGKKIEEITY